MNGLYKEDGERYFAASNTKDGFVSYFDKVFADNDCDRVFILKGGPGVGKSTFMKRLGKQANELGLSSEYFHCSSDPSSLDGIIIKEKRVAVIDGTSPHAVEPKIAGAREIIIDLGRSWDNEKLFERKNEISALSQKKSHHYNDCYNFLYSKSVMDELVYNLIFPHILFDKLDRSASRLSKSLLKCTQKKENHLSKTRLTCAFSSLGKIRFSTFEDSADFCVFVKEPFSSSRLPSLFLRAVYEYMKNMGAYTYVSYNPEKKDEINALYYPDIGVSVSFYDEKLVSECDRNSKKCRIINCARFLDTKALSPLKPLRKFYCRISENMEKQALECLKNAGEIHMELEKIYRQYTDYKTVEKISNDYFKMILR